ncbi:diguanylate cyclase/phosphodiesterase (GGDEF & EAL domains) with PAS/PAC sensor(s) [hydrothermal vent metagenome]|uniref:Diguanylate cyclase/phosphodiesterase (GGDEF & EAL domains) with PAS/PAC sensor(S) n=1 Tax=hydrothermal vent metagenome TaxID=652676 RepID=A0A1W1D5E1_9ZZZZ
MTSNDKDYFQLRKEIVVKVFLHVAFIVLVVFAIINFFYETYAIALFDFLAALIAFYTIEVFKDEKTFHLSINVSSFNIFVFFLLYIIFNGNNDNGLFWVMFVPIFLIPLNGYKKGTVISIIFYMIAFIIAYFGIGKWQNGEWNFHSYMRFVISSSILLYVTYINELAITKANLLLYKKDKENKRYLAKLKKLADLDGLTKIYNRRKVSDLLENKFNEAKRYNEKFCVAIIDIDFFKKVNDTYGHNFGDDVLVEFTHIIKSSIRQTDIFGRWGGEEFLLVMFYTDIENAYKKCNKIREVIEESQIKGKKITCSIGVACYEESIKSTTELISRADKALYKAKEIGRNRVEKY